MSKSEIARVTPTLARNMGIQLKAYPRISFQISIKGDIEMNYRIEEKDSFTIIGRKQKQSSLNEENSKDIPLFWDECNKNGITKRIWQMKEDIKSTQMGKCILGVCNANSDESNEFDYWIATEKTENTSSLKFEEMVIPKGI